MTAAQMVAQAKRWYIPFREHSGPGWTQYGTLWRTHNRDPEHGAWGPVNGITQHHTGDDLQDYKDLAVLWNGRTGLPGPLVQAGNDDNGVLHFVGWGRCNHAGGGDPDVLAAVIAESYGDYPPPTDKHEGEPGAVDGNVHFYGLENMYSGSHIMTPAQYQTAVLYSACISEFHRWGPKSTIGHKEWSDWKPDPSHCDMRTFRRDVGVALSLGPGRWHFPGAPQLGPGLPVPIPPPVDPTPQPVPPSAGGSTMTYWDVYNPDVNATGPSSSWCFVGKWVRIGGKPDWAQGAGAQYIVHMKVSVAAARAMGIPV